MSWRTQAICVPCWNRDHPDEQTTEPAQECVLERCCLCGSETQAGIYVRLDTATVPFPQGR
ncbi:hypothetical protein DFR70_111239 [Nocardia tenerifensis]|uniref:Uncharacterized protein n=1 Tax=Nocardia tenerifensis TaxID=228006 RepID=A0A318KHI0_9NOCA|nr:hypothetical protein [Nocardia tenerifensis]PXX59852.1 hypothetical protein DFR70_111239 [Nocardia tenerifensis]